MSYCRLGDDSDVYVYEANDGITCCFCRLSVDGFDAFVCDTHAEMIGHLAVHLRAGHRVPEDAVLELWKDIQGETASQSRRHERVSGGLRGGPSGMSVFLVFLVGVIIGRVLRSFSDTES